MLYPFTFHPIYKERVWGGRNLERLYRRVLPHDKPVGESWEIADRPEEASVVANGRLAGKSLRWLMEHNAEELLGQAQSSTGRFPLLVKILDAADTLSLQVHPPASIAAKLGAESKTEVWYIAEARADAELFVGLRRGTTRQEFERRIAEGTVAECFHRIRVRQGDAMFLPSGRVHAIGRGLVIFEIQQNSDTTYRVFDWNRVDARGNLRDLHIAESLASIDFNDFEPGLVTSGFSGDPLRKRPLVVNSVFEVDECELPAAAHIRIQNAQMRILGVFFGGLSVELAGDHTFLKSGQFCLIPAGLREFGLRSAGSARFLQATVG